MKRTGLFLLAFAFSLGCQPAHAPESAPAAEPEAAEPAPAPSASPAERLEEIESSLAAVVGELNEAGEYNCCVQPACTWCALHEGSCECFNNIQADAEVCPGCGLGWHNGRGVVDGVEASDVKWNITHEHGEGGGHAH